VTGEAELADMVRTGAGITAGAGFFISQPASESPPCVSASDLCTAFHCPAEDSRIHPGQRTVSLAFDVLVSLYATYDISLSLPKVAGVLLGTAVFFTIMVGVASANGPVYSRARWHRSE